MRDYGKYFNVYILTSISMLAAFGLEGLYHRFQRRPENGFIKRISGNKRQSGNLLPGAFIVIGMLSVVPLLDAYFQFSQ